LEEPRLDSLQPDVEGDEAVLLMPSYQRGVLCSAGDGEVCVVGVRVFSVAL
jgi:hypothetical protein